MKHIVIVGAGGFGREVLDVLRAQDPQGSEYVFDGFVSQVELDTSVGTRIDARWLGTPDAYLTSPSASHFVVAIASPEARERLSISFQEAGLEPATLVHPTSTFGRDVEIGAGSIVCAHAAVTTNVRLGRHVHLNLGITVGHDARLGDFVTVHPNVSISGGVTVGTGTTFGTTSCVLPDLHVGANVTVGAGAVVIADVQDGVTVVGMPARPLAR